MANQNELIRALRMIPPKWALGIVGLLIGYWLLQPVANRTFGWNLPTLSAIVNNDYSSKDTAKKAEPKVATKETSPESSAKSSRSKATNSVEKNSNTPPATVSESESKSKKAVAAKVTKTDPPTSDTTSVNEPPTYGYLKSIGRDRFESPEGLVYAPGSEEGHRLKHIARHTKDIPNRPGSHGVFEGGMPEFLATIDKGYRLAISKAKGTKTREEDGLTVMEVTFDKKIGFVGGTEGRRKGTPSTKRLRIVVNGDRLITAFPY